MESPRHPFFLINTIFFGFVLSAIYGLVSAAVLSAVGYGYDFERYMEAYFVDFNCAVSGGLVFGTAITVYWTQFDIPRIIENSFEPSLSQKKEYRSEKVKFLSWESAAIFSTIFALSAFAIFFFATFPFEGIPQYFMILAGCLQYASGVYVGRKIFRVVHMLRAAEAAETSQEVFEKDKLSEISTYVNYISTLTAIMVYVGVYSYYNAPFEYSSPAGESLKVFMLLPAIIAVPVLLFAYYSRVAIRRVYESSLERSLRAIEEESEMVNLPVFERRLRMIEMEKILRDELNRRLKTTLEDLPIAVVLGLALLSVFQ